MILETLSVTNFRVFNGVHTFDLSPRVKYYKKRPIILFGGLNGAGKTTTLTAVRLALYGRQSLGHNISQKEYSDYLVNSIHRSRQANHVNNFSNIELTFSYANMGIESHYTVKRAWHANNKSVTESLSISENDRELNELNPEQCQGFLNELIPIGVSDLFFFDGEKIAELAEDTKGTVLGDSIKKLMGLDIIETLEADLGVLLRSETKKDAESDIREKLEQLEIVLSEREHSAELELQAYEQQKPKEKDALEKIAQLEVKLTSRGGAWAETREKEIRKHAGLSEEKHLIEKELIEMMGGSFPISIATEYVMSTLKILKSELDYRRSKHMSTILSEKLIGLKRSLESILQSTEYSKAYAEIEKALSDLINVKDVSVVHDLSESKLSFIESIVNDAVRNQKERVIAQSTRLSSINDEIDKAGKNIARAPVESQIKPIVEDISKYQQICAKSLAQQKVHVENHRRLLREAMDIVRELDRVSSTVVADNEKSRVVSLATSSKRLLSDFTVDISKRKTKDLENEFVKSFSKLARKDDISLEAKIDPRTFTVSLVGGDGRAIDKNELSAGEKQIYAISILEALAKTSGRRLPIIIDTPLGRLDSVHREKLINNYFPTASHQVIILSTDTEVDEEFYADLSPEISHAFELDYDPKSGSTTANEGYFWRG